MSTDLIQHAFHGQAVRVITDEHGDPWFVAADIARILGYRTAPDMTRSLDDDEKGYAEVRTPGGPQQMVTVTEAGLYQCIFGGRSRDTQEFKRWVTHEVLPEIRRTGSYALAAETPERRIALAVIEAQALLAAKDERIAELEPPARAWASLAAAAGDYNLRDAAQILSRDHGVETGQNRLMDTLRDWGWVDRKDVPYQRVVDLGYVRARPRTYEQTRTNVRVLAKPQIRITAKGIERILARLTEAS